MATQPQGRPDWAELLDQNRQNVSYAVMGLGGALVIAAGALIFTKGWESAAYIVPFLLFGLGSLAGGLWFQSEPTAGISGRDRARLLALGLGGGAGLALAIGAAWQAVPWWKYVSGGTEVWQGPDGWRMWLLAGLFVVGLVVMFFSFLLGRGEESDNPTLRRLLYGYNAVLTVLLIVGILVALNVLAYLYLPMTSDWTEAGIYTLESKSQSLLKDLKQPVTVYVMEVQRGDRFDVGMRDLMSNVRSVTDKVTAEYVIRDANRDEMKMLEGRYKPDSNLGVIVVYGSGESAPHTFIPMTDIQAPTPRDPRTGQPMRGMPPSPFRGEDRIMSAIASLQEGKKPVIYFTQGSGELDVFGTVPGLPPERRGQLLADALRTHDNYEVKGLLMVPEGVGGAGLDPRIIVGQSVPEDAAAVIVAGPARPLSNETISAIKKYMREPHKEKDPLNPDKDRTRKGKLMVLAGVVPGAGDQMADLNLDALLREYDVEVTNERVLKIAPGDPHPEADILVTPNPELRGRNPLATLFEGRGVFMTNVRAIKPHNADRPEGGPPSYQVSELLVTAGPQEQSYVIGETKMGSPGKVLADYLTKRPAELRAKARTVLPVAVAVSEPGEMNPNDPHPFLTGGRGPGVPRVEVIGDASFVSNKGLAVRGEEDDTGAGINGINYNLFASALAWLREKPGSMGIEAKKRDSYTIRQNTNLFAMEVFPFGLMSLSVIGVGLGVWVARRR